VILSGLEEERQKVFLEESGQFGDGSVVVVLACRKLDNSHCMTALRTALSFPWPSCQVSLRQIERCGLGGGAFFDAYFPPALLGVRWRWWIPWHSIAKNQSSQIILSVMGKKEKKKRT
jgi:hypothetical protein